MTRNSSATRRTFVKSAAAGVIATWGMASPARSRAPSGEVNLGLIGVGIRGYQLHRALRDVEGARVAGISDLSDHYIERIRPELRDPQTPVYRDYRQLLAHSPLDAVVIASPDHWHAQMTIDALKAGKHVYVEKPLAYSLEEAIRVRDVARAAGRITQVGYQRRSISHFYEARDLVATGILGEITQVLLWSSRNRLTTAPWRAYDDYDTPGLPAKSGPEHVDWARFQANRPTRPYDAKRFFHWQCYDEYSTGIFGILMSHPLDAANLVLQLGPPESCSAAGGIYRYDDGRTVPDTCQALFNYPSRKLSISFVGSSNNAFFQQEAHYRGTNGTIEIGTSQMNVYAERRDALFEKFVPGDARKKFGDLRRTPVYQSPPARGDSTVVHLKDFVEAIRSGGPSRAPVEACFTAMVAVAMAIRSFQTGRTMYWDAARERMVG